jgi:alpha-tubulin suppressor-like RCC1 family protein
MKTTNMLKFLKHIKYNLKVSIIICFILTTIMIGNANAQLCIKQITTGLNHTVVVKTDGTLWAWGNNTYGQLGDGSTNLLLLQDGIIHSPLNRMVHFGLGA